MASRLDHVAIIVDDLDAGIRFYGETAGLGTPIVKDVPELKIRCAFFDPGEGPIIELVQFSGKSELAHGDIVLALEVDDLDAALAHYRAKGVRVFDQPPTANLPLRRGWVLKTDGHGTVIELCPKGDVARFVRSTSARSTATG
jgi:catechol 2,3-dioxygenase-like lactoylglutathione lyase family enzyme